MEQSLKGRTEQSRTEQNRMEQSRTEQNRMEQSRTEQSPMELNPMELNPMELNPMELNRMEQSLMGPSLMGPSLMGAVSRAWSLPIQARSALQARRRERSEGRRDRENRGWRWANASLRSTSARAGWACPEARRTGSVQDARPPLLATGSRPRGACETHPAAAAGWRPQKGPHRQPTRHSGQRVAEARAPAPAWAPLPEARSPPASTRQCRESPAMPAEPRPPENRRARPARPTSPASRRRTRWRCATLRPPWPQNLRQSPRSNQVRSGTLHRVDHLYSW
jgi:hypothetical protein